MDVNENRWLWTSLLISGVLAGDWVVHVPDSPVHVLSGSSVTVPCMYDFPNKSAQGTPHKVLSEMWCRNQSFCITPTYVYHSSGIFPDPAFQGRVQYLGMTGSKNCSFRITELRASDSGIYVFRFITDHPIMKLPGQKGLILLVTDAPLNISVKVSIPGEIVEGISLTLTCISSAASSVSNFTWFKTSGDKTSFKGFGQKLFLKNVRTEDSGRYTCMAQNAWGSENATIPVTIKKGSSGVSILGIVFGIIFLLIAIGVIAACVRRHKRSRYFQTSTNADSTL